MKKFLICLLFVFLLSSCGTKTFQVGFQNPDNIIYEKTNYDVESRGTYTKKDIEAFILLILSYTERFVDYRYLDSYMSKDFTFSSRKHVNLSSKELKTYYKEKAKQIYWQDFEVTDFDLEFNKKESYKARFTLHIVQYLDESVKDQMKNREGLLSLEWNLHIDKKNNIKVDKIVIFSPFEGELIE